MTYQPPKNPVKVAAGRKGGLATAERHGSEYMAEIGSKGAATTWSRYALQPIGTSLYAMVDKVTGMIKAIHG